MATIDTSQWAFESTASTQINTHLHRSTENWDEWIQRGELKCHRSALTACTHHSPVSIGHLGEGRRPNLLIYKISRHHIAVRWRSVIFYLSFTFVGCSCCSCVIDNRSNNTHLPMPPMTGSTTLPLCRSPHLLTIHLKRFVLTAYWPFSRHNIYRQFTIYLSSTSSVCLSRVQISSNSIALVHSKCVHRAKNRFGLGLTVHFADEKIDKNRL